MPICPGCGTVNPQGSKFCASCGKPVPPEEQSCMKCGALNPPGSKFCGGCGMPLQQTGIPGTTQGAQTIQKEPAGRSIQQVRYILWAGTAIFLFSAMGSCSRISLVQSMYGMWAHTGLLWFFLLLDLACAGLALYAAARLVRGDENIARVMLMFMIVVGIIGVFLSLGARMIFNLIMSGGLMAGGFWGRQLLAREKQLRL